MITKFNKDNNHMHRYIIKLVGLLGKNKVQWIRIVQWIRMLKI
jgi:hypothetical protein